MRTRPVMIGLLSMVLVLLVVSPALHADSCDGMADFPCGYQFETVELQRVPTLFKLQARVAQAKLPVGEGLFAKVIVKVLRGTDVVCLESFTDVQVRQSVLNLEIGRNISCELDELIAESSDLAFQICLGGSENCLKPVELAATPYAIKATYAHSAQTANKANIAAQANYAHRVTADTALFVRKELGTGYFDFYTPGDETCDPAWLLDDTECSPDAGYLQWTPVRDPQALDLTIVGKTQGSDALVELNSLVLAAEATTATGDLTVTPSVGGAGLTVTDRGAHVTGDSDVYGKMNVTAGLTVGQPLGVDALDNGIHVTGDSDIDGAVKLGSHVAAPADALDQKIQLHGTAGVSGLMTAKGGLHVKHTEGVAGGAGGVTGGSLRVYDPSGQWAIRFDGDDIDAGRPLYLNRSSESKVVTGGRLEVGGTADVTDLLTANGGVHVKNGGSGGVGGSGAQTTGGFLTVDNEAGNVLRFDANDIDAGVLLYLNRLSGAAVTSGGDMNVSGDASVTGTTMLTGAATLGDELDVAGASSLNGGATVAGGLVVSMSQDIGTGVNDDVDGGSLLIEGTGTRVLHLDGDEIDAGGHLYLNRVSSMPVQVGGSLNVIKEIKAGSARVSGALKVGPDGNDLVIEKNGIDYDVSAPGAINFGTTPVIINNLSNTQTNAMYVNKVENDRVVLNGGLELRAETDNTALTIADAAGVDIARIKGSLSDVRELRVGFTTAGGKMAIMEPVFIDHDSSDNIKAVQVDIAGEGQPSQIVTKAQGGVLRIGYEDNYDSLLIDEDAIDSSNESLKINTSSEQDVVVGGLLQMKKGASIAAGLSVGGTAVVESMLEVEGDAAFDGQADFRGGLKATLGKNGVTAVGLGNDSQTTGGFLTVDNNEGNVMRFDADDIDAGRTLHLNRFSDAEVRVHGDLHVNGAAYVGWEQKTCSTTEVGYDQGTYIYCGCPAGKRIISGGVMCRPGDYVNVSSHYYDITWRGSCIDTGVFSDTLVAPLQVNIICANIGLGN